MNNKAYVLTKTKITSGLQCEKKLWFDFHDPEKIEETSTLFAGNRFGEIIRQYYGEGLDLSNLSSSENIVEQTAKAIQSEDVHIIYEAAFIYKETLVRTDVLRRKKDGWEILEAKSSKELKESHIPDVAIQSFIVKAGGLNVTGIKLLHVNNDFVYQGDDNYKDLIKEVDIINEVEEKEKDVENYINQFRPLEKKETACPKVDIGDHCKKPYPCIYFSRCASKSSKENFVSYKILPNIGTKKDTKEFIKKNNIKNIQDIPENLLNPSQIIVQKAHKENKEYFDPALTEKIKKYKWPFYFMDFETIQQLVPKIKGTRPYEVIPFQWSIHKWQSIDKPIEITDNESFLEFTDKNIERKFIEKLLKVLGTKGTIFSHNAPTENSVLKRLKEKESCKDLAKEIDQVLSRVVDTLPLARSHFYNPKMMGQYSIKKIIKAIPSDVSYEKEGDIAGGMGAQLSWFKCTEPNISKAEIEKQRTLLINYCANDTFAMYDLIKYWVNKN